VIVAALDQVPWAAVKLAVQAWPLPLGETVGAVVFAAWT
jgi:hypothetical protein